MRCSDEKEDKCQKEVIDGCEGCKLLEYTSDELIEIFETQIYASACIKEIYNF